MLTLTLTCQCGARLDLVAPYATDVKREREAFDEAHAVCREWREA